MKQNKEEPYVIGLTGTMGSGKSTCSKLLKENFNIPVIDADQIAHEVCKKGSKGLEIIKENFGDEYILENGEYNRRLMSQTINEDYASLIKLNTLLHPLIKEIKEEQIKQLNKNPIIIYDCPLLFETGENQTVDEVLLITADNDLRKERVKQRDQLSEEEILKRIALQFDDDYKLSKSNSIINNDGDLESLKDTLIEYMKKFS